MKKIKILPLILIVCLLCCMLAPSAAALDEPAITSGAAVLADADSGRIFFSKDPDKKMYPASLTKIMTVLLAIEAVERGEADLSAQITATDDCLADMDEEGSTANIVSGETMSLEELLYCALVESANEACNIIAKYIAGSIPDFVQRMNDRAAELGCTGTHFANTHGLPNDDHYTTARDMYLITQEAVTLDLFMEICNTVNHTVPATNMSGPRELSNTNGLINSNSPYYKNCYYEYARGVKTGHTSAAGYCLVSTAEKDGIHLICVILGGIGTQNGDGSLTYGNFVDTIALYNWVFDNFSVQEILSSSDLVSEVPVEMGADTDTVTVRPKDVITALLPNDEDLSGFEKTVTLYSEQTGQPVTAPVAAGQVLGEITVSKDGVVYGTTSLVASTAVELSKLQYMRYQVKTALNLTWVKIIFWVLIIALAIYVLLVIRYRTLHRRHQRDVRAARLQREKRREEQEMTRVFSEEKDGRAPRSAPPADRSGDAPSREPVTTAASAPSDPRSDKARRDYFEEFFRQDSSGDGGEK